MKNFDYVEASICQSTITPHKAFTKWVAFSHLKVELLQKFWAYFLAK